MAGDIAEMMLDGTMDSETGEWNFDGEDGPGWPMTGAEAAAYARACGNPNNPRGSGSARTKRRNARRKRKAERGAAQ